MKLFMIYKKMIVKAESLLYIFKAEKKKRGDFTYNTISQANIELANESLKYAKTFFKHCNAYLNQE
jgi:phosphoserine aminotransferase